MNKKLSAAVICCLTILISVFIGVFPVSAENTAGESEINALIDGIIAYKEKEADAASIQSWIDGALSDGAGTTSEWYVLALLQSGGNYDFTSYIAAARSYISANNIASASSRQKLALALIGCGRSDDPFVKATLGDSIGEQGIMSWVFGLHMLNNGCVSEKFTAADIVDKLLSLRLSDGGWALTGSVSDVDVTAMTITALAPYRETRDDIMSAVDEAIILLSEKQLDSGGYKGFSSENPESTAQVIIALSTLGIDPVSDPRFIKNEKTPLDGILKFKRSDGSFCHAENGEANNSATYQALCSFTAMQRAANNMGSLFVFQPRIDMDNASDHEETSATDETEIVETAAPDETEIAEAEHNEAEKIEASGTSNAEADKAPAKNNTTAGYKPWACLAVSIAAAVACLVLWIRKKRRFKSYLFVLIAAGIAVLVILFTSFQSADSYYSGDEAPFDAVGTVELTIRCDTIVGKADSEYIPSDGVILPLTKFDLAEGESVFDLLVRAAKKYDLQMENEGSVAHGMAYISGINYLYEFDFGDLSGWVYHVNGVAPSVGCGEYKLADGDVIEWLYTCELGNDLK